MQYLVRKKAIQEENLLALLRNGAFQFADERKPWFPYTSGQIGPYFVQSIAIERDGAAYAAAVAAMTELSRAGFQNIDAISGGETRDWDFSNPVAVALRLPHIKLYKDGKTLGADIRGKRILHIADLNNEGSSVRDYWKPILEKNGGVMAGVVFYVDRLEDGADVMRELALRSCAVVPLDATAWTLAKREGYLTDGLLASLLARLKDRPGWAMKALQDRPDVFMELYRNEATRGRAEKIIRNYPDLKNFFDQLLHNNGIT